MLPLLSLTSDLRIGNCVLQGAVQNCCQCNAGSFLLRRYEVPVLLALVNLFFHGQWTSCQGGLELGLSIPFFVFEMRQWKQFVANVTSSCVILEDLHLFGCLSIREQNQDYADASPAELVQCCQGTFSFFIFLERKNMSSQIFVSKQLLSCYCGLTSWSTVSEHRWFRESAHFLLLCPIWNCDLFLVGIFKTGFCFLKILLNACHRGFRTKLWPTTMILKHSCTRVEKPARPIVGDISKSLSLPSSGDGFKPLSWFVTIFWNISCRQSPQTCSRIQLGLRSEKHAFCADMLSRRSLGSPLLSCAG